MALWNIRVDLICRTLIYTISPDLTESEFLQSEKLNYGHTHGGGGGGVVGC